MSHAYVQIHHSLIEVQPKQKLNDNRHSKGDGSFPPPAPCERRNSRTYIDMNNNYLKSVYLCR